MKLKNILTLVRFYHEALKKMATIGDLPKTDQKFFLEDYSADYTVINE